MNKAIVASWLKSATNALEKSGIGTARLDALLILEDAWGKDRSYLLAHPELPVSDKLNTKITQALQRRATHEPLAYILGHVEFYGREFVVNQSVLVPRPESETMIDLLKQASKNTKQETILDIGTGSGALAITAKLELPEADVTAIDIDPGCLKVALANSKKHKADIKFYQGNLLDPVPSKIQDPRSTIYLLCNLPYVPDSHTINQAAMTEPKIAIFGGPDGLDVYRQLFKQFNSVQIARNLQFVRYVLTESLPFQHKELAKIAKESGFKLLKTDDFIQVFETKR